ncbi:SDR family oxidoreductase [Geobacter pelophilus]|uniref:SDR family oxidoreductase n=1 Tax=Geoanaerobacter pelophilus TaxID=60036 RepID=A0AAW4L6W8_9BACT|nr:SDR family oxidoreductase [Geoanaerobacter pelophilus]MBT0665292.1 SDR family oxidoreductase [Geoanaerobacter pelophilus]
MQKLSGKNALITGGNSGIGLATARLFREHGASLIITGRDQASLAEARTALGEDVLAVQSDAGNLADIEQLMNVAKERCGQLDVLFVNAGMALAAPFELVAENIFDEMVAVNIKGIFFTIQKALPLLANGSSVIITTSITNQMGSPNFSVYGACKAAQRSLVKSLGLELIGRGIRVNAISPGPIATPMYGRVGLPNEVEQMVKAEIQGKSPLKRFGESEEVAKVALFLASDDSSYIVGDEIVVDGGMSLL